jgi:uncharacterized membrane protein YqjE
MDETLPDLIGRLGSELTTLFDLRLSLLRVEIKEEVDAYVRRSVIMAAGGLIIIVGFALANVALAFFASTLFATSQLSQPTRYALGFMFIGLVYLGAGGAIVTVTRRRLAAQDIVPKGSVAEFEKDKQLIKTVIQH